MNFFRALLLLFVSLGFTCSSSALPNMFDSTFATRFAGDTIDFSGYQWVVKDSRGKTVGPGRNYFSCSKENIWTDESGRLHLRVTYRDERWICPEVQLIRPLGHGKYAFHIDPLHQDLDKDLVVGMFLYDYGDSEKHHHEIDIEFSTWGKESDLNTQYVVQPDVDKAFRFDTELLKPSIHCFEVSKKQVLFTSRYADTAYPSSKKDFTGWKKQKLGAGYTAQSSRVCINVWLYKATEPSDLKEFEIVVSKFEFTPED
ncbi:MAG: hypothetical protein ACKO1U_10595 [Bacteroidota bacterium]